MTEPVTERPASYLSGWLMLPILLLLAFWIVWLIISPVGTPGGEPSVFGILMIPVVFLLFKGFLILEPNMAAVMTFFGKYAGTVSADGFFWVNPLYGKQKISLRAHNLNTPTLKVNDRAGNPIEVAAVIVWRVYDTARAVFDVEDYVEYVTIQSESAVRQVCSGRWYDGDEKGENSLRGDLDTVARLLTESIQSHCSMAGLEIIEARISHLAYAPEIAGAMLRRQQAVAVVAAREQIVEGAVGMVAQAVEKLEKAGVVTLEPVSRARLVSNLMTVLVSESEAQPVVSLDTE
ncbi:MAG: SPFH domain-containing protein [Gammaproteobacteria bacterium]|nr:MAG: SPFH domain-containing protein [Gammaproteobacteria bacterium]